MYSRQVILNRKEDYEDIILNDEKRQIYKRIIIQKIKSLVRFCLVIPKMACGMPS
jgi:NAD(P)H-nitrite reductase large subunit